MLKLLRHSLVMASILLVTGCIADASIDDSGARRTAAFWRASWVAGDDVENYDSLASMAEAADLVVYGTILGLEPGRVFGTVPDDYVVYLLADMKVDEVISGIVPAGPWGVEVMVDGEDGDDGVRYLQERAPLLPSVYFLREKSDSRDGTTYYRLANSRAALVNESGTVDTIGPDEDGFLRDLDGTDFDALRSRLREIASARP